jgi:hypothetical protein
MVKTTTRLERLASVTGKPFAQGTPTSSPRKRPSGLTVRDDWCRLENFADMYDGVHQRLVEAGVEEKLDYVVWRDMDNNIVNREADAYGRQTSYSLLHPYKLMFFDEVGENISQKGDGNTGGQKFVVAKYMRAQVCNSFKDNHFTVLGFTVADGRAVMFAISIAASKLKVTDVAGFNPSSKDAEEVSSDDMKVLEDEIEQMKDEHSNDVDRMFPFEPKCSFNVTEVPTFITCSKNGSITSQLLTNMLCKMDDLELFDRSDVVNPFLLCEGHDSCCEEPFLEYTLEGKRPWTCCIGVPYGTSMWQVDASTEQNGTFKVESKKANTATAMRKIRAGLPPTLEWTAIFRIVNVAWQSLLPGLQPTREPLLHKGGAHSTTSSLTILNYKKQRIECSQYVRYTQDR